MIILFDETETNFDSLGLGVLKDATQCTVNEELNGSFDLEMLYSVSGQLYKKLSLNKIIYAKANPFDEPQPFRITSISKPIKGTVKITAEHISYDLNGIPVKAIDAKSIAEVFSQIKSNSLIQNNFNFRTDITSGRSFKTTQPYNARAILMGDEEESLVGVYNAELKFDKFDIHLLSKRGANRGAQVCYGQNMTNLTHEITNDRLYNGIFPYYHRETTKTETETEETFKQVYIVGTKEYAEDWLSFSKEGAAYHPLDSNPVQIASDGDHYQEVYAWNSVYQRYEKKIYNETVTLIENVISPEWIKIEWKTFPNVKCVANAKGYYKKMTDTDWGEIKGVGDVIFEGNILKEGLSGLASNMIIYYSEVIPKTKESNTKEVNDIKDVTLDDPIIWLNTLDSKTMAHDRVLLVDLTDKFGDDEPTKDALLNEANKYISEYKLGNITTNTTVSFVEVNENQNKFKNFMHVELGDTVQIIYNDIGINTELRVISTSFDAIAEKYKSVELGTKKDTLSTQSVQNGDNITSLTNDAGYADVTTVNKLIAQTVTAEFVNAVNATLSKAQIEELKVSKIEMPGVIEASQYVVDKLVANLLLAETAEVSKTLTAGNIKVNGEVNIYGGSISISDKEDSDTTYFEVDRKGNVKANSVDITGGSLEIGESFKVTNNGDLTARNADISGSLTVEGGEIIIGTNENSFRVAPGGTMEVVTSTIDQLHIGEITTLSDSEKDSSGFSESFDISSGKQIKIFTGNSGFILGSPELAEHEIPVSISIHDEIQHERGAYTAKVTMTSNDYNDLPKMNVNIAAIFRANGSDYEWRGTIYSSGDGSRYADGNIFCTTRLSPGYNWEFISMQVQNNEPVNVKTTDAIVKYKSGGDFIGEKAIGNLVPNIDGTLSTGIDLGSEDLKWHRIYANDLKISVLEAYQETIAGRVIECDASFVPTLNSTYLDADNQYYSLGSASKHWNNVYAAHSTIITSDKNNKENINDISDKYSKMFDELRPVTYKLKGSGHDRLHTGFIAQEIEESMKNNDISSEEFGALCYYTDDNGEKHYSLRYSEFIALNTMEIQKLKKEIEELKNEIKTLKEVKYGF